MRKVYFHLLFMLLLGSFGFAQTPTPTSTPITGGSIGIGRGDGTYSDKIKPSEIPKSADAPIEETTELVVLSKPRPAYTEAALENQINGKVTLKVAFLASGGIGSVITVSSLPDGLTEQAIAAARQIKFEPKKTNGVPISVTKLVEFSFTIYADYYGENDAMLKKNVKILEMPLPQLTPDEIKKTGGKIKVNVLFGSTDTTRLFKPSREWSKEFLQKIREAVARIKYTPAIHQKGNYVAQLKEIEYVFTK